MQSTNRWIIVTVDLHSAIAYLHRIDEIKLGFIQTYYEVRPITLSYARLMRGLNSINYFRHLWFPPQTLGLNTLHRLPPPLSTQTNLHKIQQWASSCHDSKACYKCARPSSQRKLSKKARRNTNHRTNQASITVRSTALRKCSIRSAIRTWFVLWSALGIQILHL